MECICQLSEVLQLRFTTRYYPVYASAMQGYSPGNSCLSECEVFGKYKKLNGTEQNYQSYQLVDEVFISGDQGNGTHDYDNFFCKKMLEAVYHH